MECDLHSKTKVVLGLGHQARVADAASAAIDTIDFESLEYIIHVGSPFTGGGYDITLEESPDDGSGSPTGVWTALSDDHVLGGNSGNSPAVQVAIGDAGQVYRVGSVGKERHQRVQLTETGTISAGDIGVTAVLSHPRNHPTDDQNT